MMYADIYRIAEEIGLELGGTLPEAHIHFCTYGKCNKDRTNVVLVCHALTANAQVHEWWAGIFGEGRILDPTKHFIICANNLGSPYGTTSAKSINPRTGKRYGMNFPEFTIRDTAALHMRLLDHLRVKKLSFIIGGSCGGNICQEIAYLSAIPIEKMVLMCCSAQETPWAIGIHEAQRVAMEIDSTLYDNTDVAGQKGLYASRAFALSFYRSHPSIKLRQSEADHDKTTGFRAASYIRYQGEKFIDRYDAHCYYTQLKSLDTHHMGRGRESIEEALAVLRPKTLCVGFNTDLLIPVEEQRFLAAHIPQAEYVEIKTLFGHDAFLIETEQLNREIIPFLSPS